MLDSKYNWQFNDDIEDTTIDLNISNIIKKILHKRGIKNTQEAEEFLYPKIENLHDPYLFQDMDLVVNRVFQAIENQEKILIYGDYDADGVTSTAVLVYTLREMGALVDYYIPNRFTEGYGPNVEAFQLAKENGVSVIITVDNGIAAPKEASLARELGIDLIITDHHEAQDEMPEAYAIIHPGLEKEYPFNELAGVGVAFKVAQALSKEFPKHLLSLVAIGTVADLVSLRGENRILVKSGLKEMDRSSFPGIHALKKLGKIETELTTEHIGFIIGPRLNAVGRLQDASLAVDLLLESDDVLANDMAEEINAINQERQQIVRKIAEEAFEEIEATMKDDDIIIVAKENWNPGVLGIVASRIVNKYHRPAIVLGINDDGETAKGSARSIDAFDLFKECMNVKDLFLQVGGHAQAAGMTVELSKLEQLREALNERASLLTKEDFQQHLIVEDTVQWKDLDLEFPKELELLAPFGMQNEKPLFQIESIDLKHIRKIGAKKNHLKLTGEKEDAAIEMIGFQFGEVADALTPGASIDVLGEIEVNEWNGNKKLQVKLQDIRCRQWQLFDFRGKTVPFEVEKSLATENTLAISFNQRLKNDWINIIPYEEVQSSDLEKTKRLALYELPNNMKELESILHLSTYEAIYLCYQNSDSQLLSRLANRDDFKELYITLKKHKRIMENQKPQLAEAKNWSMNQVDFMIKVFFELNFVKITNGEIIFHQESEFKPLEESKTYLRKIDQREVEELLYFSNYKDIKSWFNERLQAKASEGEVVYEF
ncbi:single-stranded-DNA-specific exonuclease RecJ [Halalkalibacillus halophilus]|uniref:single-stranded-DNA-specific exonuclease RecJ n=1 Tax=Halalkalibacillus halophilus TaxID=392827 RepID=UPI000419F1BF|nr:single-stranded-DNA-specific exonuclease RecJ [Halalkalibacillus halophilus]